MARPKEKMLDPQWQAERKKSRHKLDSGISIRIEAAHRAQWRTVAERSGLTLQAWVIRTLDAEVKRSEKGENHE